MISQEQLIYFNELVKASNKLRREYWRMRKKYPGADKKHAAAGHELDKLLREINHNNQIIVQINETNL